MLQHAKRSCDVVISAAHDKYIATKEGVALKGTFLLSTAHFAIAHLKNMRTAEFSTEVQYFVQQNWFNWKRI